MSIECIVKYIYIYLNLSDKFLFIHFFIHLFFFPNSKRFQNILAFLFIIIMNIAEYFYEKVESKAFLRWRFVFSGNYQKNGPGGAHLYVKCTHAHVQ